MKQLVGTDLGGYTFDPVARQITLTGVPALNLEQLLVITNVTRGVVLYNFADPTTGAALAGNTITLTQDMPGMAASDRLQIFIEVADPSLEVLTSGLHAIAGALPVSDGSQRVRCNVETWPSTLTTVTGVTNVQQVGGQVATLFGFALCDQAQGVLRQQISVT